MINKVISSKTNHLELKFSPKLIFFIFFLKTYYKKEWSIFFRCAPICNKSLKIQGNKEILSYAGFLFRNNFYYQE